MLYQVTYHFEENMEGRFKTEQGLSYFTHFVTEFHDYLGYMTIGNCVEKEVTFLVALPNYNGWKQAIYDQFYHYFDISYLEEEFDENKVIIKAMNRDKFFEALNLAAAKYQQIGAIASMYKDFYLYYQDTTKVRKIVLPSTQTSYIKLLENQQKPMTNQICSLIKENKLTPHNLYIIHDSNPISSVQWVNYIALKIKEMTNFKPQYQIDTRITQNKKIENMEFLRQQAFKHQLIGNLWVVDINQHMQINPSLNQILKDVIVPAIRENKNFGQTIIRCQSTEPIEHLFPNEKVFEIWNTSVSPLREDSLTWVNNNPNKI